MRAGQTLTATYQTTVNVNKLFDKHYFSSVNGGFYGDRRNVMVNLHYGFP